MFLYCVSQADDSHGRLHTAIVSASDCRYRGHRIESQLRHINFVKIDLVIITTVILLLMLTQERQLSVIGKKVLVNYEED